MRILILWSLSLINVNIKLDYLWTHPEATSPSLQCKRTLTRTACLLYFDILCKISMKLPKTMYQQRQRRGWVWISPWCLRASVTDLGNTWYSPSPRLSVNSSGRTQVLYKAHVLYCALFSRSCFFFLWKLLKSAFLCFIFWKMCFIFVSYLSGWNFYFKFSFYNTKIGEL